MRNSVEAYLDNFGLINVYIDYQFYNGKTDRFYLKDGQESYFECLIRNIETHATFTKYELVIPGEYRFDEAYTLTESHGYSCPIYVRGVVQTKAFNDLFYYDGDDLGATYTKYSTVFKVYAPTAIHVDVELTYKGVRAVYPMVRSQNGVHQVAIDADINGAAYVYLVHVNGEIRRALDPYAYSGFANGKASAVIDISAYQNRSKARLPLMENMNDAIIYECSIRDVTHHKNAHTKTQGLFVSLLEEGTSYHGLPTGLDYIKSLGITHLQLMPVFDFATVDEYYPNSGYNWGYDPIQYGVLEGSYATNPNDPFARISEFKHLVNKLHDHQIRVNLDVVFNHQYDIRLSAFDAIVPHYYFRVNSSGYLSNGSFCGNDVESRQKMMRKYIIDMCKRYVTLYDVDGLRFDLMGILDVVTMNQVAKETKKIKPEFMIYGEGWDMPTALSQAEKAIQSNSAATPEVGHFNDLFRDIIKGKSSENDVYVKGFATGDLNLANDVKNCMLAHAHTTYKIYQSPSQSINYVECHDNQTSWDKMKECCKGELNQERINRQKLMMGMVMVAQGVPFFQNGQEFCRTKAMMHNSYNASDMINQIDWDRLERYKDGYFYFKELVILRKRFSCLRNNKVEFLKTISFEVKNEILVYNVGELKILFNPMNKDVEVTLGNEYHLLFDEYGFAETTDSEQVAKALSMTIYIKE